MDSDFFSPLPIFGNDAGQAEPGKGKMVGEKIVLWDRRVKTKTMTKLDMTKSERLQFQTPQKVLFEGFPGMKLNWASVLQICPSQFFCDATTG